MVMNKVPARVRVRVRADGDVVDIHTLRGRGLRYNELVAHHCITPYSVRNVSSSYGCAK